MRKSHFAEPLFLMLKKKQNNHPTTEFPWKRQKTDNLFELIETVKK